MAYYLIFSLLQTPCASRDLKKIMSAYEKGYSYTLYKRYFYDFCCQWVDIQNVKYLKRAPEKRKSFLATVSEKILFNNTEYDSLKISLAAYAAANNVPYYELEVDGMQYPDEIDW